MKKVILIVALAIIFVITPILLYVLVFSKDKAPSIEVSNPSVSVEDAVVEAEVETDVIQQGEAEVIVDSGKVGGPCDDLRQYAEEKSGEVISEDQLLEEIALNSEKFENGTDVFTQDEKCVFIASSVDEVFTQELIAKYISPERAQVILDASYEVARSGARIAAAKAYLSSVAPALVLCLEDEAFIEEPTSEKSICAGSFTQWPEKAEYDLTWEGCSFTVNRKLLESGAPRGDQSIVEFCATLNNGEVWRCSEDGCLPTPRTLSDADPVDVE